MSQPFSALTPDQLWAKIRNEPVVVYSLVSPCRVCGLGGLHHVPDIYWDVLRSYLACPGCDAICSDPEVFAAIAAWNQSNCPQTPEQQAKPTYATHRSWVARDIPALLSVGGGLTQVCVDRKKAWEQGITQEKSQGISGENIPTPPTISAKPAVLVGPSEVIPATPEIPRADEYGLWRRRQIDLIKAQMSGRG
jgi:hypothetical protein